MSWLWPGRLALGKLAILDGDPGLGKSLVTLDLCARLSTGRPFPDDTAGPGPAAALILNGEDSAHDTVRPRLEALGADLQRVFVLHQDDGPNEQLLRLPAQTAVLDDALTRTRARLLVIDPIVAFLDPRIQTSSDASVRRALAPLVQLAERHSTAILLIRHLNKSLGRSPVYRGGGSIGFLAACRSGWLIARDPDQPAHCVLAQIKNNLAPPQPSLAYQVQSNESAVLSLSWLGPSDRTAAQLLAPVARSPAPLTPRDRACAFLQSFLREGPRTSRDIWPEAQRQGLTERTLDRAKRELAIRSVRVWAEGRRISYWLLPGQELPESVKGSQLDLNNWMAKLHEQFPPPTPLDDL
ncbi:MAG TPA: AAA family ATPase [Gemmataceae bacterium]|nr:AAA family ATPase [Gemmataceae bacterium]